MIESLRKRAKHLKHETFALYLAYQDPRTPIYARVWAIMVVAYAVSPIDLIPDFIPVLGYLDDLVLVPLGIVIALRLIPAEVMAEARQRAQQEAFIDRSSGRAAAVIVVVIWVLGAVVMGMMVWQAVR